MTPKRKPRQGRAPEPATAATAQEKGRTAGLRDALLLFGVGVGIGLAKVLTPTQPGRCGKLHGNLLGSIYGPCRLDADHEGACEPRSLFR
jgi:hypothetical protein